jgi:IS1 family transposase
MFNINRLTKEQRVRPVSALAEGNSIRSTSRMTGIARNTSSLLVDLAEACAGYHDRYVRNLRVRRLQCDEIWHFVGAKAKNGSPEKKAEGGDTWTWTALDADTKLCVSYLVGGRDLGWATEFMHDCASRIKNRVQITTDGHKAYLEAVESAFGADIDYAQLQKIYGAPSEDHKRYSPATCIGCEMKVVSRRPRPQACKHQFCRAPEPFHADEHSPIHTVNQCLLEKGRESRRCRPVVHVLQLLPRPPDAPRHPGYGSRSIESCLGLG